MPGRGSAGGGRASVSGLGKRRRGAGSEPAESDDEPRASGHGRGGRQPRGKARGRGRGKVDDIRHKSVRAVRHTSSSTMTTTTTTTATSTKSRPYNRAFSRHLEDYSILPLVYESPDGDEPEPPDNMREILEDILGAVRTSEPAEDFRRFQRLYRRAFNEDDAVNQLDTLQGDTEALLRAHVIRQKQRMSNLAALTDGSLVDGNPDRVYGARAGELALSARERLNDVIVPTPEGNFICPNFVVHVKSDKGTDLVARVQAAYDGALAARGMQRLWEFGDGPHNIASSLGHMGQTQPARVARTITCTWVAGVLKMWAVYCEGSPDIWEGALSGNPAAGRPKYVPTLVGSWIMTDKEKDFREGLAAYRNGLEWAKRQRDIVISRANAKVQAEVARGCRHEEKDHEELDADEEVQSDAEDNDEKENNHAQENNFEVEDSSDEDDGGSDSIFVGRGSGARGQGEEDRDSDQADEDIYQSFDSQRTVTTRSMSRRQSREKRL